MAQAVTMVRLIGSGFLIYLIYGETGWATALFAVLVCLHTEVTTALFRMHRERMDIHIQRIRQLTRAVRFGTPLPEPFGAREEVDDGA